MEGFFMSFIPNIKENLGNKFSNDINYCPDSKISPLI